MSRKDVYGNMVESTGVFILARVSDHVRHHGDCPLQFENYKAAHDFIWEALNARNVTFQWLVNRTLSVSDISTRFGRWWYRDTAICAVTVAIDMMILSIQRLGTKGLLT